MSGATTRAAVTYTLLYTEGGVQKERKLAPGTTVVGRDATCDLVLNHSRVSRRHVQFSIAGERCVVKDLGSRNGTYLNGQQIEEADVTDGDRLILGRFLLRLRCSIADNIVLSDDAAPVDVVNAIYRPIGTPDGHLPTHVAVDAPRLLKLLSDISRTLVGTLPIDNVLGHVVDQAFASTQAERAILLLYDEETRVLVPRVVRHRGHDNVSTLVSQTILKKVMVDRVSILAIDAQIDPRLDSSASIMSLAVRSFMCAPLWHEDEIIGLLYVDNPRSDQFTAADLDLFTAFSNYAAVAIAQARMAARVLEEQRQRERLERYHSPAVVDRIVKGSDEADAPFMAQERDLTVLFADIVGFTSLSEGLPPQQVAVLLNAFFARMTDAIFQHEGTLDKFIGDSVLAVFGAPLDLENHALHAVRAAQSMQRALALLNVERPASALQMRIAIHTGVAMVGDIGSPKRREYTVLGDVVNIASRIEDSVASPGQIVITRETHDRLADQVPVRSLGTRQLRGRVEYTELFEVLVN